MTAVEPRLQPLNNRSVVDGVVEALREAILHGRYRPGEHLVERKIGHELGVSSIAVREAFARLVDEGLVERVPRRGTFVMSMSAEAVHDLTRLRIVLEQLVVELAIANLRPSAQAEVQAIVDEMFVAAHLGDRARFFQLDNAFHEAFWRIADSEALSLVSANLRGRVAHFLRQATASSAHELTAAASLHQSWLDSVSNGHVIQAKAEVEKQISGARDRIVAYLLDPRGDAANDQAGDVTARASTASSTHESS